MWVAEKSRVQIVLSWWFADTQQELQLLPGSPAVGASHLGMPRTRCAPLPALRYDGGTALLANPAQTIRSF